MHTRIDRELPVSIPHHVHAEVEDGVEDDVGDGDFPPGRRLPSAGDLAGRLSNWPMTVTGVDRTFRDSGSIASHTGHGMGVRPQEGLGRSATEAVDNAPRRAWRTATRARADVRDPIERLKRLVAHGAKATPPRICFVGAYPATTRAHIADLRRHVGPRCTGTPTTFDAIHAGGQHLAGFDKLLTLARCARTLAVLAPSRDPVTSHVASVRTCVRGSPEARRLVGDADVVVYATGSDDVLDGLPADIRAFEYRHVPDPAFVERTLLPAIERLRAAKTERSLPEEAP